jgi:hypothetical protein
MIPHRILGVPHRLIIAPCLGSWATALWSQQKRWIFNKPYVDFRLSVYKTTLCRELQPCPSEPRLPCLGGYVLPFTILAAFAAVFHVRGLTSTGVDEKRHT